MIKFGKFAAQICVAVTASSILLVPVQAAETIPVPRMKPVMFDEVSRAPLPSEKPDLAIVTEPKPLLLGRLMNFKIKKQEDNTEQASVEIISETDFKPLSSKDAKIYKTIFAEQRNGKFKKADELIATIQDERLLGHVLYQRYMHPSYKSEFSELKNWLARYAGHPGAQKIYNLASIKDQSATHNLNEPESSRTLPQMREPTIKYPKYYVSQKPRSQDEQNQVKKLAHSIEKLVKQGKALDAAKLLRDSQATAYLDTVEKDQLQTQVAAAFLYRARFESAFKLAADAANRSGKYVPQSAWIAGLALWQKGMHTEAAAYFETVGESAYSSGWLSAAGYFWSARAQEKTGKGPKYNAALKKAAEHYHTFYGLLAASLLQQELKVNWKKPEYTGKHEEILLSNDAGKRAVNLVAAGQYDLAEEELLRLRYKQDEELREAVLAYAVRTGLPRISSRLGTRAAKEQGAYLTSAIYPELPWEPKGSYKLDPALIHAIVRQESRYDQNAKSHSGAVGLMQLMPSTAKYVAQKRNYTEMPNVEKLKDAEFNMTLGQDYVEYLLKNRLVKGDVVSMLISYNAGPGNLQKWRKRIQNNDDPLLFIEMLPVQETRDYVERVMANYWIYRSRENKTLPSLAALAQGKSPSYASIMTANSPYQLTSN